MGKNFRIEPCGDCVGFEQWGAWYTTEEGKELFALGYTPTHAFEEVLALSKGEIRGKVSTSENIHNQMSTEVENVEVSKENFKPMDLVKNQVNEFIDGLGKDDKCLVSISTEIYLKATPNGGEKVAGDVYLALAVKKKACISDECILQDTMDYPAKKVYEFFEGVK